MNKYVLTWLSYSGLLAMVLTASPAHARKFTPPHSQVISNAPTAVETNAPQRELEFTAPSYNESSATNSTLETGDFEFPREMLFDDELGAVAIDLFGCDCASCRYAASNMLKSGMIQQQSSEVQMQSNRQTRFSQASGTFQCTRLSA